MRHSDKDVSRRGTLPVSACVLALLAGNVYLIRELFRTEYTSHLDSIEAAYIAISRVLMTHWHDRMWWPLWYGGIPFQNTYPPLLHNLVAITAEVSGMSAALAHHAVTAAMYCLGPVTLFWLAYRLSGDRVTAFVSGVFYSVFSTSALLLPSVRHDLVTLFGPRRLQALLKYGEGPHITSMTLLPLPVLFLDLALRKNRPVYWILSAISMAAVVLTNWLGGFALAAAIVAFLFARDFTWIQRGKVLASAVYAYVLASPWIPPSTIKAVRTNAQRVGGAYSLGAMHLVYLACAIAAFLALWLWLRRLRASDTVRFGALFLFWMAALPLCGEYLHVYLLPQPERYHLEMEMAIAILFGCGWTVLQRRAGRYGVLALLVVTLLCLGYTAKKYRRLARELITPIDIQRTVEYEAAQWFDQNMREKRVMVPGTVSFWLNAFTDTPQLWGGFDQGITNAALPAVHYQIYSGMSAGDRGGDVALAWLRAYGVQAVLVGGPGSREFYKPFQRIQRFAHLPVLWRNGDDTIYEVPNVSSSLAHVVRPGDLVTQRIDYAHDVSRLRPYLRAIDPARAPAVDWTWRNWHTAQIHAPMKRGDILSVQISHHPGWVARSGGQVRRTSADALGLLVVEPQCEGDCTVELEFTGGIEMAAAQLASSAAFTLGMIWVVWAWVKRSKPAGMVN